MWLTETPWPPALLLLVGAVIFAIAWTRNRKVIFAVLAGFCLLLIPVVFVVEHLIVTPAEEIEAAIHSLRDAVVSGDIERTLEFFSTTAIVERAQVVTGMTMGEVQPDLRITDVSTKVMASDTIAVSQFRANGTFVMRGPFMAGTHRVATRWELSWRKEAGEWKITEVQRLNPITGEPMPLLSRD